MVSPAVMETPQDLGGGQPGVRSSASTRSTQGEADPAFDTAATGLGKIQLTSGEIRLRTRFTPPATASTTSGLHASFHDRQQPQLRGDEAKLTTVAVSGSCASSPPRTSSSSCARAAARTPGRTPAPPRSSPATASLGWMPSAASSRAPLPLGMTPTPSASPASASGPRPWPPSRTGRRHAGSTGFAPAATAPATSTIFPHPLARRLPRPLAIEPPPTRPRAAQPRSNRRHTAWPPLACHSAAGHQPPDPHERTATGASTRAAHAPQPVAHYLLCSLALARHCRVTKGRGMELRTAKGRGPTE
uniref:Uncharacterized protein n=1 Tax=Arundo donax TaxID=35708 RepID=A0A0A9U457_ARUDO